MAPFDDLLRSYLASSFDALAVEVWYGQHSPSSDELTALAESIGAAFLARRIDFATANGLLNQLMVHVGFESAPPRFWDYYIAFEDFEASNDPDLGARKAVMALGAA